MNNKIMDVIIIITIMIVSNYFTPYHASSNNPTLAFPHHASHIGHLGEEAFTSLTATRLSTILIHAHCEMEILTE